MNTNDDVVTSNTQSASNGLTRKEIDAAIRSIKYRKLYNQRADVKDARRKYNQRRSETVRYALDMVRRHPELLHKEEGV